MTKAFWARIEYMQFIRHYHRMDDASVVADVRQSVCDLIDNNAQGDSFGSLMVRSSNERIEGNRASKGVFGKKGGRPRKSADSQAQAADSGRGDSPEGGISGATPRQSAARGDLTAKTHEDPSADASAAGGQDLVTTPLPPKGARNAGDGEGLGELPPVPGESYHNTREAGESATGKALTYGCGSAERAGEGVSLNFPLTPGNFESPARRAVAPKLAYGTAKNVMMTAEERGRLDEEFGDASPIIEELSDYLQQHPRKYKSHYAAARNWCRRRKAEGLAMDGHRMTQGERLALFYSQKELEIKQKRKEAVNG